MWTLGSLKTHTYTLFIFKIMNTGTFYFNSGTWKVQVRSLGNWPLSLLPTREFPVSNLEIERNCLEVLRSLICNRQTLLEMWPFCSFPSLFGL